jgi:hypothetical protein
LLPSTFIGAWLSVNADWESLAPAQSPQPEQGLEVHFFVPIIDNIKKNKLYIIHFRSSVGYFDSFVS